MRDNQLAVFFRNNHFSTIWKNQVKYLFDQSQDLGFFYFVLESTSCPCF